MKPMPIVLIATGIIVVSAAGFVVYDLWDDYAGKSLAELWDGGYLMVLGLVLIPWIIAAFIFVPQIRRMIPHRIAHGVTAHAKVIKVWDTGVTLNTNPQVGLLLEFTPAGGTPVQAQTHAIVSRLDVSLVRPGIGVEIVYDAQRPQRLNIVKLHLADAGGGTGDSVMRLEQLNQLREKGLISEEEYHQKRAEIVALL